MKKPGDYQPPKKHYDLELAVLEALTPHRGFAWPAEVIAAVCGISVQAVRQHERRIFRKVRARLAAAGVGMEAIHG